MQNNENTDREDMDERRRLAELVCSWSTMGGHPCLGVAGL